jgi:hypothetical protein
MPRIRCLLTAALALTACATFVAPAAAGGRSHQLAIYKVDEAIDVQGEDGTYAISCRPGDIALDGMWRIDDVDQDNDYAPDPSPGFGTTGSTAWDVLESVLPVSAQATAVDTYTFTFLPVGGGDIRAHLFLTCLSQPTTATNGHTHTWQVGPTLTDTVAVAAGATSHTTAPQCAAGSIAIANGFDWTGGSARGTVSTRWPSTAAVRAWDWTFYADGPGSVDMTWACLRLTSNPAGSPSHSHRMVTRMRTDTQVVKKDAVTTHELACGSLYKAGLGAWDFGASFQHTRLWFLGMDPRPKLRAYKVLNADSVNRNATFGDVCFKERTT